MKFINDRPFADPDKAARRLMEHARDFEPVHDGRIYIEKIDGPFCTRSAPRRPNTAPACGSRSSAVWLVMHESGTFVKFTQAGADLFA